jgi:hypothetical protein
MKSILTLWLLLLVGVAFAQAPAKQPVPEPKLIVAQVPIKTESSTTEKERDLYKLLYENTAAANEKYITITQWTVGMAVTLLSVIIAAQIFFNYTLNKKELDNISAGIREQVNNAETALVESIRTQLSTALTSISMDKEAMRKELRAFIQKRFDVNEKLLEAELKNQKDELLLEIKQLRVSTKKAEGDLWTLKGYKSIALGSYIAAAILENSMPVGYEKPLLDDIIKVLGEVDKISHRDYEALQKLLPSVKAANADLKVKIEAKIKDMPTYRYIHRSINSLPVSFRMPRTEYVRNSPGESSATATPAS